jgi:Ca-activated chloride channel family protein
MSKSIVGIHTACDRQQVACEVSSQRMIEWIVTVPEARQSAARVPLNLALVLDRSGSMSGEKLTAVQQAACHVLDLLDERDRVALVAYDDQITLLAASGPVNAVSRMALKARIQSLTPGGSTDLGGGWLEGCREIAAHQLANGINRALLLTDGLANHGITDIEQLTQHARELCRLGVATSTFGVGLDFNEQLLEQLATYGGGHFYYIERPNQIIDIFRRELGELLSVVARESVLSISIPHGVSIEVLGDVPHERSSDRLRMYLGDLFASEQRSIYTRILTPPDTVGTSVVVAGEITYADIAGQAGNSRAEVAFSYMREGELRMLPINASVLQRSSEIELASAAAAALKLDRAGKREEAQAVMQHTLAATAPYAPAPASAAYQTLANSLEEGLTEQQRKQAHYESYHKRQSRK